MLSDSTALKFISLSILPNSAPTLHTNKGYLEIYSSCHTKFMDALGKKISNSTLKNEIRAKEAVTSSPPAIWRPWPPPCRDEAETCNTGISITTWPLEKISPLKGGGITFYPQGSDTLRILEKPCGRKPSWDTFL